jgi:hypothetical protein
MINELIKLVRLCMLKISPQSHKSNEMDHEIEIESQSQVEPPSPNPHTIEYSRPPLMFLDPHLKYLEQVKQEDNTPEHRAIILYGYKLVKHPGGVIQNVHVS